MASGYRYDVFDATDNAWRSVFERHALDGYFFPRDPALDIVSPDDEGRWTLALATEGDERYVPRTTNVEYTQEGKPNVRKTEADDQTRWRLPVAAFRWNGWSAAAPQPGSSLNGSGDAVPRADNVGVADQQALLEVNYSPVLGTLPRLRYGRTYTLRARATDLAGNSKTVDEIAACRRVVHARDVPSHAAGRTTVAHPHRPQAVPGVGTLRRRS